MKTLRKVTIGLSVAMLAGVMTLAACKDDDDDKSAGTKAGEAVCDCVKKAATDPMAALECAAQEAENITAHADDEQWLKDYEAALKACGYSEEE